MKDTKPKLSLLVAAALVGMSSIASGQVPSTNEEAFTPIESLAPEVRAYFEEQVRLLDQSVRIDWNSVIVGINERNELILKDRLTPNIQHVEQPSCWTDGH